MADDKKIIDVTGAELKPGKPNECQGNGKYESFECCCDECDYFLDCFPEWDKLEMIDACSRKDMRQKADSLS